MADKDQVKKKWNKKWWVWLIVAIVLIGVVGNLGQDDDSKSGEVDKSSSITSDSEPAKKWKVVSTLEGTKDNKKTDVFKLKEGDVRIRYDIEGKTDTTTSLLYLLKEGTTKSTNERGDLDVASSVATVIGTDSGQKIVKTHSGNYFFEINSSDAFKYKIYIEQ